MEDLNFFQITVYIYAHISYLKKENTHWMVDVIESLARGQLVGLLDLLQSPDSQEHADRRSQGKEIHWLKIQRVVDNRHLRRRKTRAYRAQSFV